MIVLTMRGIGLALVHSTGTSTSVENVVSLSKLCSTLQLKTVQSSGTQQITTCLAFCIAHMEEDLRPGTEQYRFIEQCHIGLMKFHNHSGFYKDFSSWLYIVFLVFFLKNEAFSFYRRRRRWQQALPYSSYVRKC